LAGKGDKSNKIVVGKNTYIGEFNNFRIYNSKIIIGDDCLISQFVSFISANHNYDLYIPIRLQGHKSDKINIFLGNDVWVGCNSVILPGVIIGDGSIIASNSVVNCNVPPYEIWGGTPAKFIKKR
jgi:acetyltransferase-like isoleucine patch superfamily enzyme